MTSLGAFYWYVKKKQCGYMEQGSKYITVYVKKHVTGSLL